MLPPAFVVATDSYRWNRQVWGFSGKGFALGCALILLALLVGVTRGWSSWLGTCLLSAGGLLVTLLAVGTPFALRHTADSDPVGGLLVVTVGISLVSLTIGLVALIFGIRGIRRMWAQRTGEPPDSTL